MIWNINRRDILKIIALVAMLVDHTLIFFGDLFVIRFIGRMGFPLYCWLLYDGFQRTSSKEKYMGRLAGGALLSQWPFVSCFTNVDINVMVTLLFGFIGLMSPLAGIVLVFVANKINTDYGATGVLVIMLMRVHYVLAVVILALHEASWNKWYVVPVLATIPLIWWCKRDKSEFHGNLALRRIWYFAYPGHLLLYYLISQS